MMDEKTVIKKAIFRYLDPDQSFVFLFGSRATDHFRPSSDYDIGLYSGNKIPLKTIAKIKDCLEDYPIPVNIDFVDFSVVSEEFKSVATRDVQIWNRPKKDSKLTLPF